MLYKKNLVLFFDTVPHLNKYLEVSKGVITAITSLGRTPNGLNLIVAIDGYHEDDAQDLYKEKVVKQKRED